MPIVVTRSGVPVSGVQLPPAQRDKLWALIVKNYAEAHPEVFDERGDRHEKKE